MNRVAETIDLKWAHRRNITGKNVTVAILDTGITKHPDFINKSGRIIAFKDILNERKMPYDDNGHGTHVDDLKNKRKKVDKASKRKINQLQISFCIKIAVKKNFTAKRLTLISKAL